MANSLILKGHFLKTLYRFENSDPTTFNKGHNYTYGRYAHSFK